MKFICPCETYQSSSPLVGLFSAVRLSSLLIAWCLVVCVGGVGDGVGAIVYLGVFFVEGHGLSLSLWNRLTSDLQTGSLTSGSYRGYKQGH
jgi:hypothetical protein